MLIDQALVPLRPRTMWESADVGTVLARQHLGVLFVLYTVPAFIVALGLWLSGIHLSWAMWVMWWLKPAFEAPLTAWIGRAMFGEALSWRRLPALWWQSVRKGLLGNLTVRRLHFGRGVNQCVIQLENAKGNARRARQNALAQSQHNAWLLLAVMYGFECLFALASVGFVVLMLPEGYFNDWTEFEYFLYMLDLDHNPVLLFLMTFIFASIAPFFVCGSFMLYINARTKLEAWDLDIAARRMQAVWQTRLNKGLHSTSLLLAACISSLYLLAHPMPASAQTTSPAAAKNEINQIYQDIKTFGGEEQVEEYIWKKETKKPEPKKAEPKSANPRFDLFATGFFSGLAGLMKIIFIGFGIALLLWLIWRIGRGLTLPAAKIKSASTSEPTTVTIADEALPDDIARSAEACLRDGDVRAALSMLYRGTINFYAEQRDIRIRDSDTEADVWRALSPTVSEHDAGYLKQLINSWVRIAYGHHEPHAGDVTALIHEWRMHYGHA